MKDKCPFCGIFQNDPNHKHQWTFTNLKCLSTQIANMAKENADLKQRLAEAQEFVEIFASDCCSDCELDNGKCIHQKARAFLTPKEPT